MIPSGLFDQDALEATVRRTLDDAVLVIPPDAHGAFLTVANQDGIKAVIAVRIADAWQVKAVVEHDWRDKADAVTYGVTVTGTF